MDASSWPMNAPTHTAATANQWASGRSRMTWGRRGSTSSRSQVKVHGRDASDVPAPAPAVPAPAPAVPLPPLPPVTRSARRAS